MGIGILVIGLQNENLIFGQLLLGGNDFGYIGHTPRDTMRNEYGLGHPIVYFSYGPTGVRGIHK